jgi:hypothetical protein
MNAKIKVIGYNVEISGHVKNTKQVNYVAPAPPDHRSSYAGSALPFPNIEQAFDNTPSAGIVNVDVNGNFVINIATPNAYYTQLGTIYVPPTIRLSYEEDGHVVNQSIVLNGIPYKTLTYPWQRQNVMFYDSCNPTRSQEEILRSRGYDTAVLIQNENMTLW